MNRITRHLSCILAGLALYLIATPLSAQWQLLPNRFPDMSVHVTDSTGQKILLGTHEAGVWYTDDGGAVWQPFNARLEPGERSSLANAFALDAQADTLLATIITGPGGKWVRSFDGGATWQAITSLRSYGGPVMQVCLKHHNDWFSCGNQSFAISTDYGDTWSANEHSIFGRSYLTGIRQDTQGDSTVFMTALVTSMHNDSIANLLFRSDNLGRTWSVMVELHHLFGLTEWAEAMDVIRLSNGNLCATVRTGDPAWPASGDLLMSSDDGVTWQRLQNLPTDFFPEKILEDSDNPGRLFVCGSCRGGVLRSDNYGQSWTDGLSGLPDIATWSFDLYRNPARGALSVIVSDYGIYRSVDHGDSWQRVASLPIGGSYTTMAVLPGANANFTAYESGWDRQWMLETPFTAWREITSTVVDGDSVHHIGVILDNSANRLTAIAETRPMRAPFVSRARMATSTDQGVSWLFGPVIPHVLDNEIVNVFRNEVLTRILSQSWSVAKDSLHYSDDLGLTWHEATPPDASDKYIGDMAQSSNALYVTTNSDDFYTYRLLRSTNLGATWNALESSNDLCRPLAVVNDQVYVIRDSDYRVIRFVNESRDERGVVPLDRANLPHLIAIPNAGPCLVAINENSLVLWVSDDLGLTWNSRDLVLPFADQNRIVYGLTADTDRNRLWANTGIGPCWIDLSELAAGDQPLNFHPADFTLLKCYPNPFNSEARIIFDLEKSGKVKLDLFNLEGRLVRTLVDDIQEPGHHELRLDGSGLASGSYFLKLKSPVAERTQRILLLK